jgi:hypothetical protein
MTRKGFSPAGMNGIQAMDFILKMKDTLLGQSDKGDVPRERRETPRLVLPINAVCVLADGTAFSVTITDVGIYGMRLEMPRPQAAGNRLSVKVIRGQGVLALYNFEVDAIRTEVLWCRKKPRGRDFMVGVKYADTRRNLSSSWIKFIFNKFGINIGSSIQRRKDIRIGSRLPVTLVPSEGANVTATGYDLGLGGLLAGTPKDFPIGGTFVLNIGPYKGMQKMTLRGRVVRRKISKKTNLFLLGIAFQDVSYENSRLLTRYLLRIIKDAESAGEPG